MIVAEIMKHNPAGLLVVGSSDAMDASPRLVKQLGSNGGLAMSRGYCVAGLITKILRLRNKNMLAEASTRGAQDQSSTARVKGNEKDRVAEVHLIDSAK